MVIYFPFFFKDWVNKIYLKFKSTVIHRGQSDAQVHSLPSSASTHRCSGTVQKEKVIQQAVHFPHKITTEESNQKWNVDSAAVGRPWSALCLYAYWRERRAGFPIQRAQATAAWRTLTGTRFQSHFTGSLPPPPVQCFLKIQLVCSSEEARPW